MATTFNSATSSTTTRSSTRTTPSTSRPSSTSTTSSSRISTSSNTLNSSVGLSLTRAALTRTGPITAPSLSVVADNGGSEALNMPSVIAITVIFSFAGACLLLFLTILLRRRRQSSQMKGVTTVVYRDLTAANNHPAQTHPRPYNQPRDLQSWINARSEESRNEGGGSSTLASPTVSEIAESNWPKTRSPLLQRAPNVTRKSLPPNPIYADGQSAHSSIGVPVRGWREVVNRAEAIPIPNRRPPVAWTRSNSEGEEERTHDSPYYQRTSSELFHVVPAPAHHALVESSPTPSSMCVHDISNHLLEESRGLKIGKIPSNQPLVYFPQNHEGHISARASMHSGNTHCMQQQFAVPIHAHGVQGVQRIRTRSLPMAHLRKARSVETMGPSPRKPMRRPSRKEVPKYVLDEFGEPVEPPTFGDRAGPQAPSRSMPLNRPKLHSKSRSVSMAPSIPAQ